MIRRSVTTGRFLPARIADQAPLFCAAPKSQPHVRGNATRRARQRARVLAVMAALRAECGL